MKLQRRIVAVAGAAALALVTVLAACGAPKAVGNGGDCFQTVDCDEGLVCAPAKAGGDQRVCTSDLGAIAKAVEAGAPMEAAPPDGTADGTIAMEAGDSAPTPPNGDGGGPKDAGGDQG